MSLTTADARRLEHCLSGDGIALIPTDTVYGLACNPNSASAVRRIYELKRRPPIKPAAVMFFALEPALRNLPELEAHTCAALRALLPGPVTLLLPNPTRRFPLAGDPRGAHGDPTGAHDNPTGPPGDRTGPPGDRTDPPADRRGAHDDPTGAPGDAANQAAAAGGQAASLSQPSLGLRVPKFDGPLAALATIAVPALQSSANLSGGPDPRRLQDVADELRTGVDLVLDGGELEGVASTVIDLSEYERQGSWRIVREGPLGAALLTTALKRSC